MNDDYRDLGARHWRLGSVRQVDSHLVDPHVGRNDGH